MSIIMSLSYPNYPFLGSHKLLINYLVTSRQPPGLYNNNLKEIPRCSPALLINLSKEMPDFTPQRTYHLPTGERWWWTSFPTLAEACYARLGPARSSQFPSSNTSLRSSWSPFSQQFFCFCCLLLFNFIRLLPSNYLQHGNYSHLYVLLHPLCPVVLPDFFIISFPHSPLTFLSQYFTL